MMAMWISRLEFCRRRTLASDSIKLPESNDVWFLDTIIKHRSSSRHSWILSLWLAYARFELEAHWFHSLRRGKFFEGRWRHQRPREKGKDHTDIAAKLFLADATATAWAPRCGQIKQHFDSDARNS